MHKNIYLFKSLGLNKIVTLIFRQRGTPCRRIQLQSSYSRTGNGFSSSSLYVFHSGTSWPSGQSHRTQAQVFSDQQSLGSSPGLDTRVFKTRHLTVTTSSLAWDLELGRTARASCPGCQGKPISVCSWATALDKALILNVVNFFKVEHIGTGPNFIELLKQKIMLNNFLLSRNEQDTSHKLYTGHGSLAGNLILVSKILLCLANLCA